MSSAYQVMLNCTNERSTERLINRVESLYRSQQINCSLEEVERRVRSNTDRFKRSLSRARRYAKRRSYEESFVLWIACHLFDLMKDKPSCFYCGRSFEDFDFMGTEVHLEHFIPRSKSPTPIDITLFGIRAYTAHHPHRIVLACPTCNRIKSNLSDKGFLQIANDAEAFFGVRRYRPQRRQQLRDFAEIYYWFVAGPQGYAERHRIEYVDAEAHWQARRARYRQRWLQRTLCYPADQ